jgi:single-strand DNA-binding protein
VNVNRVILTGNLVRDPESILDGKGCQLGLAVNDRIKRNDEWQDHASFFDIVVWGKQAENCLKYLSKGRPCAIDGKLRQERWEKDGNKRSAVRVIAESVQFLDSKKDGEGGSAGGRSSGSDEDIPF